MSVTPLFPFFKWLASFSQVFLHMFLVEYSYIEGSANLADQRCQYGQIRSANLALQGMPLFDLFHTLAKLVDIDLSKAAPLDCDEAGFFKFLDVAND